MSEREIKELLEKQLRLLSEASTECMSEMDLAALTSEMVNVARFLLSVPSVPQGTAKEY